MLYTLRSVHLLFTAAIVSNNEAIQQTLNISLDQAYLHVFVSVETLIWIRSIAVVLIIVAHALRHVGQPSNGNIHSVEQPGQATKTRTPQIMHTPGQPGQEEKHVTYTQRANTHRQEF